MPFYLGLAVFVAVLMILIARNSWIFTQHRYEDGDFAANAILIDKARHLRLVIGNYSRVGFNHPGPALLYVQALAQIVFHDVVRITPAPFGAHVLGGLILNSALVGTSCAIVARLMSRAAAVALAVASLGYAALQPGLLSSTWMPNLYVWPFLLFLVAATALLAGEWRHLWAFVLASGLLVHGHVSFVTFVVGIGLLVIATAAVRARAGFRPAITRRSWTVSTVLLVVFVLPIAIHTLADWPGEITKYLRYSNSSTAGHHTVGAAAGFVRKYWGSRLYWTITAALILGAALLIAWRVVSAAHARVLRSAVATIVAATGLTVFYAMRGVDDLSLRYVAIFYFAVPIFTVAVAVMAVLAPLPPALRRRAGTAMIATACALGLVFSTRSGMANPYQGAPWIPEAYRSLHSQEPGPLALRFETPAWPQAAGLIEEARRQGQSVCIEGPAWHVVFTQGLICTAGELARASLVEITPGANATNDGVLYHDAYVTIRAVQAQS